MPRNIVHIITGLQDAGAEGAMTRLINADPTTHTVVSLTGDGKYGPILRAMGISVHLFTVTPTTFLRSLLGLRDLLVELNPDVVQCWMYEADVFGGWAARLAAKPVCWSIRFSTLDTKTIPRAMRWAYHASPALSRILPDGIIACGHVAKETHIAKGYTHTNWHTIPNGYDFTTLRYDPKKAQVFRQTHAIPPTLPLIGMVARFDPQKDHETLLRALATLGDQHAYGLVLVGRDTDSTNAKALVEHHGLTDKTWCVGQADVVSVFSALDIHVLASRYGEGFPNVVAESAACGCLSLSTDSGDARYILDPACVVDQGDTAALARLLADTLQTLEKTTPEDKQTLRAAQRARVLRYDIDTMVANFHHAWDTCHPTGRASL